VQDELREEQRVASIQFAHGSKSGFSKVAHARNVTNGDTLGTIRDKGIESLTSTAHT
jgi:hypothetical protein